MATPQRRKSKPAKTKTKTRARILIVEARYYEDIADALLQGATRALKQAGAAYDVLTVPGALEIPGAIAMAMEAGDRKDKSYDGAVALGCVIRGDTLHFEIVAEQSARAIMDISVSYRFPVGNGILTVDTSRQAWQRASLDEGDKGGEAAQAALALVRIKRGLARS